MPREKDPLFCEVVKGLEGGDFSRLAPLFDGSPCRIIEWFQKGYFDQARSSLAEALTCACFLGNTEVVDFLLAQGIDPLAGAKTGLNGFHWAVNRGNLETVKLLIRHETPMEEKSMYGGTVLGTAVWSALNEPRADHLRIIEDLLKAGARRDAITYPSGNACLDEMLQAPGTKS